jgi:hypothetical protein
MARESGKTHSAGCPTLTHPGRTSDPIYGNIYLKGDALMKLTPPKVITWWIALILGVLALLGFMGTIAALSQYAFWLALIGLGLLLVACIVRNL